MQKVLRLTCIQFTMSVKFLDFNGHCSVFSFFNMSTGDLEAVCIHCSCLQIHQPA